jgi:hypothetical protein
MLFKWRFILIEKLTQVGLLKPGTPGIRLELDQRIFQNAGGQYIMLPKHLHKPLSHNFKVLVKGNK